MSKPKQGGAQSKTSGRGRSDRGVLFSFESLGVLHRAPTSGELRSVARFFVWACSARGSGDTFQRVQQSLLPLRRDPDPTCVRFHLLSTFPFQELDQVALEFTSWLVA